jgi:aspartate/methionine/tyrosine aminotransferase
MTALPRLAVDALLERFWSRAPRPGDPPPINMCVASSAFDAGRHVDLGYAAGEADLARYADPRGDEALRVALSALYAARHGVDVPPSRFVITDGALGGLLAAFSILAGPGDEIVFPAACFPPYRLLARIVGAAAVDAPMTPHDTIDAVALRGRLGPRVKAIVVNSPSNPLGVITPRRELEALAELGIPIVSDEVYDAFGFAGEVTSLVQLSTRHVVVSSVSKGFSLPGLRVGWVVAPPDAVEAFVDWKATANVTTSLPAQRIAGRALGAHAGLVDAHRAWVRRGRDLFVSTAARLGLRPTAVPEGGFFGRIDVSGHGQVDRLVERLLDEQNLAIFPSSDFATPTPAWLRVNFACQPDLLVDALGRIARILGTGPGQTMTRQ